MKMKELREEEDDRPPPLPLSIANVLLLQEGPPTPWINRRKESRAAEEDDVPLSPLSLANLLLRKFAPITQRVKRTVTTKPCRSGSGRDSFARYIFTNITATLNSQNWYNDWDDADEDGNVYTRIYDYLYCSLVDFSWLKEGEVCKELPIELCGEIGKRLSSRLDILRFRSVCKSWRSSLPSPTLIPIRVPPLPKHVDPGEQPCIVTEVSAFYEIHWEGGLVLLEEVDQGDKFYAHRRYTSSNSVAKIDFPAISFTSWWMRCGPCPYDRLSFISKSYELRQLPQIGHTKKLGCSSNIYAQTVIIVSSARDKDKVNPSFAKQSDLGLVTLVSNGPMKGRLALFRLGCSTWAWDTDFCTRIFANIAGYKGGLCALDCVGGDLVIMDYDDSGSLGITQVARPSILLPFGNMQASVMYEDSGEVYLTVMSNYKWIRYKLFLAKEMWVLTRPKGAAILAHRTLDL